MQQQQRQHWRLNNGEGEGTIWPAQRQQDKFGKSLQNCMRCELNEENQMVPNAIYVTVISHGAGMEWDGGM